MVPASVTLAEMYWQNSTLFCFLVLALISLLLGAYARRKTALIYTAVALLCASPILVDYVYPFHVLNARSSCFVEANQPGFVPHGLVHHPSEAEADTIRDFDDTPIVLWSFAGTMAIVVLGLVSGVTMFLVRPAIIQRRAAVTTHNKKQ